MNDPLCHFAARGDGWCRCTNAGCTNVVRAADPGRCRARCRGQARDVLAVACRHLGDPTGGEVRCRGCPGSPRVHALFACQVHGECLPLAIVTGTPCCRTCGEYEPLPRT